MTSRYQVTLNGISLSGLADEIYILDVNYAEPEFNDTRYRTAKRHGNRKDDRIFNSASVTISFEIHAYDTHKRQAIRNAVCAWAKNGGRLEINDREGQYLECDCSRFPAVASARNWTDPFTVTFTGNEIPFWQEIAPSTLTLSAGTSGNGSLFAPGSADGALVEAKIHANASLSSVSLTVNGRTLGLSGLSVASGKDIRITYDKQAIQSIKVDNTSLLDKLTGVDDLLAKCGELNAVSFTASASVTVTISVRGYWL